MVFSTAALTALEFGHLRRPVAQKVLLSVGLRLRRAEAHEKLCHRT
jgi:hypothetical protein